MAKKKVLLVDDDQNLLELISLVVGSQGTEVFSAANGADALKLFQRENPDLVIVDWVMKPYSGYELGKLILAMNPNVKLVIMTGMSDEKKKQAAKEAGFYDFISKPFNMNDLVNLIERAL